MATAETELYQMGWNDVLGNIRRASLVSEAERDQFLREITKGAIGLPNDDPEYVLGTREAALALLDRQDIGFKGPDYVIEDMESKCI